MPQEGRKVPPGPGHPLLGVHILVVDDHDDSREILMHVLRYYGAQVTTAATATEASAVLDGADLVVTDVRMPGHDGLWLLDRVRQRAPRIPVVAISAYSDLDAAPLRRADFDRVLRKPVDMQQLLDAIGALLRDHRAGPGVLQ